MAEMSKAEVLLRYDGPELADHKMDVRDLAPALLAFGNLCREANKVLNGDRASVRVLVNADINANCVTISFDVIQSLYEAAKSLLQDDRVATAKEILEWIGILGIPTGLGLFQFLRAKGDKPVEQQTHITDARGEDIVQVKIIGDGNTVNINPNVAKLAADPKVLEAARGVVRPVAERQGIESATFYVDRQPTERIDKPYARDVTNAAMPTEVSEPSEPEQHIIGHITICSPVFDPGAAKWKFFYNGHVEGIDISKTSIAQDIFKRGKVVIGDTWKVRMQARERKTSTGYKIEFKVIEVLDFQPGNEQSEMDFQNYVRDHPDEFPGQS